MIRQKIIKNCPVTINDINIAEAIFGPDIGALKGKTTRQRARVIRDDTVEVPPELYLQLTDMGLHIDIMFTNGMPNLTAIDDRVRCRSLVNMDNRTADEFYESIDKVLRRYNSAGMMIKTIYCDGEIKSLMDDVKDDMGIDVNISAAGEHESMAERNNETIGGGMRSIYHNLPYKNIPRVMIRYMAMIATESFNYYPAKGGVSAYYSPYVLMNGRDIDYQKHLRYAFGAYVQVN